MIVRGDAAGIQDALAGAGMSLAAAAEKARAFTRLIASLSDRADPSRPVCCWFVPGRIEVLGKHTDYAGGRSLICAVERGFCFAAVTRTDNVLRMTDVANGTDVQITISTDLQPVPGQWTSYPIAVTRRVAHNFPGRLHGAEAVFSSDLPPAAGMSSSSALIVGTFLVLSWANSLLGHVQYRQSITSDEALASYLGTVENGQSFGQLIGDRGVGTFGGSEDHTAILCSKAGMVGQFRFCPAALEGRVALPEQYVFAIGSSGVVAEKTREAMTKYNRLSEAASRIVAFAADELGTQYRHLAEAVRDRPGSVSALRDMIARRECAEFASHSLLDRLEQFYIESEVLIPAAAESLERADIPMFGRWTELSQHLAEVMLENQVPQTCWLARAAREYGADAASAFGAGFGGSVWALVRSDHAESFARKWKLEYAQRFPAESTRAVFFLSRPGSSAFSFPVAGF